MEMIKTVVKQFYPPLILLACVSFTVYIFFSAELNSGKGTFEGAGHVYTPMMESDEVKNDGLSYIESNEAAYVPMLKYNAGARSIGDCLSFKTLFDVQREDGSYVNGSTEDGFAIYLMDIKNQNDTSALETLSPEEIVELEEIPASFVYDKEQDLLHLHASGIYVVYIKVYGSGGGVEIYEFNLPIEIS